MGKTRNTPTKIHRECIVSLPGMFLLTSIGTSTHNTVEWLGSIMQFTKILLCCAIFLILLSYIVCVCDLLLIIGTWPQRRGRTVKYLTNHPLSLHYTHIKMIVVLIIYNTKELDTLLAMTGKCIFVTELTIISLRRCFEQPV